MNAILNSGPTSFEAFWRMGFRRLVPIIPHDAAISERSSLYARIGTGQDSRGKAVGVRGADGRWFGMDWISYECDEADLRRWQAMGAGIGVKCGQGLLLIDADTLDKDHAKIILQLVTSHFGATCVRIGNWPKAGYLIRCSEPIRYMRVDFGPLTERGQPRDRVEILSDGRQFVAHGIHPKTKAPYTWPLALKPFDELPVFAAQRVVEFLNEVRSCLPASKPIVTEGAQGEVNQASLRGDLDTVRKAVTAIPNTSAAFPTRESYRDFGYAIKAALPDNESEAFELFADWCARWQDGVNDPDVVAADWRRMRAPFRRGASWIFELAERFAPDKFRRVDVWFNELPDEPESLFTDAAADLRGQPSAPEPIRASQYTFPDAASIPARQWLYGSHYIRGFVSATVAPGGLGKSSLTIVEALAMASGKALLGVEPKGQFRVWLWNGEDPLDELNRRVAAAMTHYGLTRADVGDRLCIDSGQQQQIILATETRTGASISEGTSHGLVQALKQQKIDALVIDPFVSAHRVNENDNGAIDLVVKRLARIAAAAGAAVEVVHHVRKTNGAEVTVEDARGATALVNGARVTRALTRMTEQDGRALGIAEYWPYWRFGGVSKNNLAPATAAPAKTADWYTLRSVALGNGSGEGAFMSGDAVGVVVKAGIECISETESNPDKAAEALRRIEAGEWRADIRARDAWVGHPVAQAFGLDATDKADQVHINGILKRLRQSGAIVDEPRKDRSRHTRIFVHVAAPRTVAATSVAHNVFG